VIDLEQIQLVAGLSRGILEFLVIYQQLAIFLGSFFFAESVILAASFLSAQGLWSFLTVFIFALLGTLLSDFFWYFLGIRFLKATRQWNLCRRAYNEISNILDKITKGKHFLALLFIKFLYGTRFLIIVYLAMRKIPFRKFVIYDTIGTTLWLLVIIPVGWLAGKGMYQIISIYRNFTYTVFGLILFLIAFKTIERLLRKKIFKA